ncbi:MAG TPA: MASE1 domain-containing protein [Albitalea sp.]|nr:MASE1 domain-containing protein [Albitalea sp.]
MSALPTPLPRPRWAVGGLSPLVAVGYLLLYLALDWISFIHPMRGLNITPWNPQSALAVALLLWRPRGWWLVWVALAGGDVLRGVPDSWWPAELLSSVLLTLGYAVTAAALRRWLGAAPQLATRRGFLWFVLIIGLGALLNAALYVGVFAAFGIPPPDRVIGALFRGWIGDAVGFLVTLPLLLVLGSRERRRHTAAMLRSVEWWLLVGVAAGSAYAVFARSADEQFKFFYLLFLPVVWGAARFGVIGAVWSAALVQVLLIVAVQSVNYRPLTVFELQVLMAALAATGLLLGTTVDEREDTAQALRASLQLAAAGDMAAALAHELNQPLTALSTYARASQLLAGRLGDESQSVAHPLVDVTGKLVNEASRASEVVKRLRDFFRERSTELQPTEIAPLLGEVVRSQAAHAESLKVRLEWRCDPGVPPIWLDRVQIAVVLRNLVENAVDAARQASIADAWVAVHAQVDGAQLIISVRDSGSGIAADDVARVFESRLSSKPGGMGIGLGISRAIVQAHGGRLWAEAGPGGRFSFSLPVASVQSNE